MPTVPVPIILPTNVTGLLNVGPGANPPQHPDPSKGAVTGVWGYVGNSAFEPQQTTSPPANCGVLGQLTGVAAGVPGAGVIGVGGGKYDGVEGTSETGVGVHGISGTGSGITPQGGTGAWGDSAAGYGICGTSKTNIAVFGSSTSFVGVRGESASNGTPGVFAVNTGSGPGLWVQGTPAAQFKGDVDVQGTVACSGQLQCSGQTVNGDTTCNGNHHVTGTMTVDVDVVLSGSDCAEQFDVASDEIAEPGTVVVINSAGALEMSRKAYDKKVAGVISGAGDYRPGMILGGPSASGSRCPVALLGKVYCKVDADIAPISVGDLLTTSATPGHAMKADNATIAFGAVIGKALKELDRGRDLLPILVALQ